MNNTILRRAIQITLLILVVPVTLLTLCAEPAIGRDSHTEYQNGIGHADADSPTCSPSYAPLVGLGFGVLHGQISYGQPSNDSELQEKSPERAAESPFAFRIDWIIGRTCIWSINL